MDMFALDDALADWEAALPSLRGPARLPVLLPLAWHLRQRDTARALELAAEGLTLLPAAPLPVPSTPAAKPASTTFFASVGKPSFSASSASSV